MPEEVYTNFIEIINSTVVKYRKYHFGWKRNYTSEALFPFVDDIRSDIDQVNDSTDGKHSEMTSLILQRFMNCLNKPKMVQVL